MVTSAQLKARFSSFLELHRPSQERLSTGVPSIDALTAGGVPKATWTEIVGEDSSGRTSLLLSILRQTVGQDHFCALVDTLDSFDPESAESSGLLLKRLLWVRSGGKAESALKAADLLIRAGGFGVVAVDLGDVSEAALRRVPFAVWHRLRHGAEQSGTALVSLANRPQGGSCSRLQIELQQREATWSDNLLRGFVSEAGIRKKGPGKSAVFRASR